VIFSNFLSHDAEDGQGVISESGKITLAEAYSNQSEYRFIFVNVWQPLREVFKRPLAVCDARTVDPSNLKEREFIFTSRVGYIYLVEYNPGQKWYYFPRLTPEEAILFKVFDSENPPPEGGPFFATPHAGIKDKSTEGSDYPPRESVEIRTVVVLKKS